jgi:hypothetical protein
MTMLSTYHSFSMVQKSMWVRETPLNRALSISFDHLLSSQCQLQSHSAYNEIHDHLRDHLSIHDSQKFPQHGQLGAPAALIFEYLTKEINPMLSVVYTCPSVTPCEPPMHIPTESNLFLVFSHTNWQRWSSRSAMNVIPQHASVQTWLNLALEWRGYRLGPSTWTWSECNLLHASCMFVDSLPSLLAIVWYMIPMDGWVGWSSLATRLVLINLIPGWHKHPQEGGRRRGRQCLPSLLAIKISPDTQLSIMLCKQLVLPGQNQIETYSLTGVICLSNFHFTARTIDSTRQVWSYDSQRNRGSPCIDDMCCSVQNSSHLTILSIFDEQGSTTLPNPCECPMNSNLVEETDDGKFTLLYSMTSSHHCRRQIFRTTLHNHLHFSILGLCVCDNSNLDKLSSRTESYLVQLDLFFGRNHNLTVFNGTRNLFHISVGELEAGKKRGGLKMI